MKLTIAEVEAMAPTAPTMLDVQHPEIAGVDVEFDYLMGALGVYSADHSVDLRWHFSVGIWVLYSTYVVPPPGAQEEWAREWMARHPGCPIDCPLESH